MSFTPHMPRPGVSPSSTLFTLDTKGLDKIRGQLKAENPYQAEEEVAKQFESLFIQMLLKQARQSSLHSGLFSSDQTRLAQSLADEQTALSLAQSKTMGLSDAILQQMQSQQAKSNQQEKTSTTRLPSLKTQMPLDKEHVADSLDDLINILGHGVKNASLSGTIKAAASAPKKVVEFINSVGVAAEKVAKESGIHKELVISQAALESGWGRREIYHPDGSTSHNLFGIKAGKSWRGDVVHVMTTEVINGKVVRMKQPFRAYSSYEESFKDYANLISQSQRYRNVLKAPNPQQAAKEVQQAGYATDPKYAEKLIQIMSYLG